MSDQILTEVESVECTLPEEWHQDPICLDADIIDYPDCPRCSVCKKKVSL